jgi:hypothetical protein
LDPLVENEPPVAEIGLRQRAEAGAYLVELLAALRGDSVRLSVAEPNNAVLITDPDDENFTAIQMPVRSP